VTRRVTDLTTGDLDVLPDRCRRCLFWELGGARPADAAHPRPDALAADPIVQKEAWWSAVDGGIPGRVVRVDGRAIGYCALGSAEAYARRRPPVPRLSDDALFLATAWVEPEARGSGLGRLLVQAAVKEALRRDLRAVEAYGDRRHRDGACVLPCTWLLHEGFVVHEEHPRHPVMRLDVRTTVRWAESLEDAAHQLVGRLARGPTEVGEPVR